MSRIEQRLAELGLALPAPLQLPPGAVLPFPWVRIVGNRALISGHGPTNADGSQVFGTFSSQVQGTVDLNPSLTADTPISALNGGKGLTLGSIEIGDGTTKKVIDLSSAATVDDVAKLIAANPPRAAP